MPGAADRYSITVIAREEYFGRALNEIADNEVANIVNGYQLRLQRDVTRYTQTIVPNLLNQGWFDTISEFDTGYSSLSRAESIVANLQQRFVEIIDQKTQLQMRYFVVPLPIADKLANDNVVEFPNKALSYASK